MKKTFLLLLFSICTLTVMGQRQVNLKDLKHFVGDSVMVCGQIVDGVYLSSSQDSLTLLNVGAAYPNQQLTLVIRKDARPLFKEPETGLKGKTFCVFGKVSLYKEKPQIILYSPDQLMEAQPVK